MPKIKKTSEDLNFETLYRGLSENTNDLVTFYEVARDKKGSIIRVKLKDCNPAFQRMAGFSVTGDVRCNSAGEIVGGEWSEDYVAAVRDSLDTGEVKRIDTREFMAGAWYRTTIIPIDSNSFIGIASDITAEKLNEKALRESEGKFRSIFNHSPDLIFRLNLQTMRFEYISPSCEDITGYKQQDLMCMSGETVLPEIHPDDLLLFNEAEEELLKAGKVKAEYRYKNGAGEYRWFSNNMSLIRDDSGDPLYLNGILRDVTNRHEAEQNLERAYAEAERSRQELKAILDNVPIGIWIAHDPECRNITGNEYANKGIMKVPVSANVSASAGDVAVRYKMFRFGKEVIPEEMPALRATSTGKPVEHEIFELRFEDGRIVNLLEGAVPVFDSKGVVSGAIVTGLDITSQRKTEEALELSQHKLNIALDNADIGVWELDLVTGQTTWDDRMEKMFGLKTGSFGKTLKSFEQLVHVEDLPHVKAAMEDAINNRKPYETAFRTSSVADSRYLSTKAFVSRDSEGKPMAMSGVCFDITGMKERYDELISRLNEDLLRSNRELENFAYVASHDLQEPLRMVTSFTQLLQNKYGDKLDNDAKDYIHFAVDGSKRMYDLLNGLLSYSRVKTKGREFTRVDMNRVFVKVKANLRLKLKETGTVFTAEHLPEIIADESQMIQMMQNLVENGIKFSRGTPQIYLSAEKKEGFDIFSVKDSGIGIEPQYHERIFRIFQRLHTANEYGGMGVGLAICQRIAERHRGRIWLESVYGVGSTFYFSVPSDGNPLTGTFFN